ncbi:MAG: zf-HC2 domain-containing protein [Opitutaceae bacterium]|nr:zf-HC2 domain-containing protein [Opitutaceae bacterium]
MNCREVQSELFADTEDTPANARRAAVAAHVAHCAACQRVRDDLTAALTAWRSDVAKVSIPDAELEWHAVRRRIRGGGVPASSGSWQKWTAWLGLPLAVAAAAALIFVARPVQITAPILPIGEFAHAENIEAPGRDASTMVFVDDQSGWLIVWASDSAGQTAE